ncbi:MAG: dTDP-4-dehydrorhamnose reductase [Acidobacteriaceae bacterium]|nr:dTDP-4-dehydrorhamnose reductase [Acidobacteriaceae bacterium]MBV9766404.1 dTDP-4-dehydrorhamnose reductase [Acidobacteriaceae bacterium]
MQRKVVIFGRGGQLGVELCREFERRQWSVQAFDRQSLDITDDSLVEQAISEADPQVVVNAAAYNHVDIAEREPEAAYRTNALAVRNLAMACRQADVQFVHYSTDYVFDGAKGAPYVETDMPHPLGAYAVSKLAGELYAEAYLSSPLVIRTAGVFGPAGMFTPRGNFLELMLRLAKTTNPIRVVEDHVASPTYAPAIASRTVDLVEKNIRGLFHMGGGQPISWYDYAKMIFELASVSPMLHPTDEREYRTAARRPKCTPLSNAKLEAAGIAPMPPLREAVRDYLAAREHATAHRSS